MTQKKKSLPVDRSLTVMLLKEADRVRANIARYGEWLDLAEEADVRRSLQSRIRKLNVERAYYAELLEKLNQ